MIEHLNPRPPRLGQRLGEVRLVREPLRLAIRTPGLLADRARRLRPVILLPGFGANDPTMLPLRLYLRRLGHDVEGWGLGTHGKDVDQSLDAFLPRVEAMAQRSGQPVALVGWSLGGIVARESARDRPDLVAGVVTFGSPLAGPRHTSAAGVYTADELETIEAMIDDRRAHPITVPVTAIYSRNDGIVDWITCPDRDTPGAVNVEVTSSHVGMGIDPDVWRAVGAALDDLDDRAS